jgi:hypothetical protein
MTESLRIASSATVSRRHLRRGARQGAERRCTAYDILSNDAAWLARAQSRGSAGRRDVQRGGGRRRRPRDLAVTAAQPHGADADCARRSSDAFVLDVNSASPRTKTACAEVSTRRRRYVESAVMTLGAAALHPRADAARGAHAQRCSRRWRRWLRRAGRSRRRSASCRPSKLCRSVVIKGMEALFIESMLAARHYGVRGRSARIARRDVSQPRLGEAGSWFWRRVVQHGKRRAEEMREAA